jgi:hypothetical protein
LWLLKLRSTNLLYIQSCALKSAAMPDPMSFLVQTRCEHGGAPWNCDDPVMQKASDVVRYRRHDWPPPTGYQISDSVLSNDGSQVISTFSFPPFGPFNAAHGDGGEIYVFDGTTVRITATQDGGTPGMQYFVGPRCGGDGWVVFRTDAPTGSWRSLVARLRDVSDPNSCPKLVEAFTQYRLEQITFPFIRVNESRSVTAPTIISEHYGGRSIARASSMERFFLLQGWGKVRWEAWTTNHSIRPPPDLPQRCPSLQFSTPPTASWQMVDCRMWTNVQPVKGGWSVDQFGWPPKNHGELK